MAIHPQCDSGAAAHGASRAALDQVRDRRNTPPPCTGTPPLPAASAGRWPWRCSTTSAAAGEHQNRSYLLPKPRPAILGSWGSGWSLFAAPSSQSKSHIQQQLHKENFCRHYEPAVVLRRPLTLSVRTEISPTLTPRGTVTNTAPATIMAKSSRKTAVMRVSVGCRRRLSESGMSVRYPDGGGGGSCRVARQGICTWRAHQDWSLQPGLGTASLQPGRSPSAGGTSRCTGHSVPPAPVSPRHPQLGRKPLPLPRACALLVFLCEGRGQGRGARAPSVAVCQRAGH